MNDDATSTTEAISRFELYKLYLATAEKVSDRRAQATNLPDGRTLLRMEKETEGHKGNHRDNWFIVEKFAAAGWTFITADNQYYYLEKVIP